MTESTTESRHLMEAPKDAADEVATGYAVYDTSEGRYVGGVTPDKPSNADVKSVLPKGHTHRIVRV